jgi:organic hydroperoxide reductase OsmC/OhrA
LPSRSHHYSIDVVWTGNRGTGTAGYTAYDRSHQISAPGKPTLAGSSDPAFRGDAACWSPEELFVSSLSTCHMLWFLHLAADAGIAVTNYRDQPEGLMLENADGSGQFVRVVLHPLVETARPAEPGLLNRLHESAHHKCYLARSVNFEVTCQPARQNCAPRQADTF